MSTHSYSVPSGRSMERQIPRDVLRLMEEVFGNPAKGFDIDWDYVHSLANAISMTAAEIKRGNK